MKLIKVSRYPARVTVLYAIKIIDNLGRNVEIELRYNKVDKLYRPVKTWVDGKCYGGKLRFFLDQNGYEEKTTDGFLAMLAQRVDVILERKARKKITSV